MQGDRLFVLRIFCGSSSETGPCPCPLTPGGRVCQASAAGFAAHDPRESPGIAAYGLAALPDEPLPDEASQDALIRVA